MNKRSMMLINVIKKLNDFKFLSVSTAILFLWLFGILTFDPNSFLEDVGLEGNETTFILGRRAAMLMLGFAVLLFFGRRAPYSVARQAIALGTGVTMAGFAFMGMFELLRGSLDRAILKAVFIEILVAILFFRHWLAYRKVVPPTAAEASRTSEVS